MKPRGEQQIMSSPGLVAEEDVDTSIKGKGVIVGERFVEEI